MLKSDWLKKNTNVAPQNRATGLTYFQIDIGKGCDVEFFGRNMWKDPNWLHKNDLKKQKISNFCKYLDFWIFSGKEAQNEA